MYQENGNVKTYQEFLSEKVVSAQPLGFDVELSALNPSLFDWQKVVVQWAVKRGRAALFEACGLGKTLQQCEWARLIHELTGGDVLILAPLAVSSQTVREGAKLGIEMLIPIMRSTGRHDILQYLAERMGYKLVSLAGAVPDKPTVTEELLDTYPAVTGFHQAIQDKQPLQAVGFLLEQATGELEQDFVAYRSTLAGQKGGK